MTGWALIACGLVALSRRGDSRSGPLLAATGFAWFLGNFTSGALYLYRGPLVHLLVIAGHGSLRDEGGVLIEQGRGNPATRNVVVRAWRDGIHLAFEGSGLRSADNVIRRNVVTGSRGDAFAVASPDRHSFLGGNLAIAGKRDGFDIDSRSAKLHNNRAVRNAELGIEAVPGVIDGGGNTAQHNGDPRRCTNISCG